MPTPFQPANPQSPTNGPLDVLRSASLWIGLVTGLMVVMLVSIALPRVLQVFPVNWFVMLGSGVLSALLVMAVFPQQE